MNVVTTKTIEQAKLTSECFRIQIFGKEFACSTCEYKDQPDCGGKDIVKTGKNAKGHTVPLDAK